MAALNEFLFHERSYKPVSNPANGTGSYTASDTVKRKTSGDSPLAQSLKRCHRRIDKDLSRGHITERDKDRLYKKSNEMFMELPEKDRNILGRGPAGGLDLSRPVLVLDHQPRKLEELAAAGVDVDLSGHTHDGQLFPGNLTVRLAWENACGYLRVGEMHSIVTSGVGLFGPNMRVATRAESGS